MGHGHGIVRDKLVLLILDKTNVFGDIIMKKCKRGSRQGQLASMLMIACKLMILTKFLRPITTRSITCELMILTKFQST